MSSWQYAFMFPESGKSLRVAEVIRVFSESGFEFDRAIYPAFAIDDDGHLEHGDAVQMTGKHVEKLEIRLRNNEQFLVECRNQDLFFAISFAGKYQTNPHMMIGWSRTIFGALGKDSQEKYLQLIRNVANACNATNIIVVNDPPDYFEDRFLAINGRRFLDRQMPSGNKYDIQAVWISIRSSDKRPEGVKEKPISNVGEGFQEYTIE
jgi:hypothetical protein